MRVKLIQRCTVAQVDKNLKCQSEHLSVVKNNHMLHWGVSPREEQWKPQLHQHLKLSLAFSLLLSFSYLSAFFSFSLSKVRRARALSLSLSLQTAAGTKGHSRTGSCWGWEVILENLNKYCTSSIGAPSQCPLLFDLVSPSLAILTQQRHSKVLRLKSMLSRTNQSKTKIKTKWIKSLNFFSATWLGQKKKKKKKKFCWPGLGKKIKWYKIRALNKKNLFA